MVRKHKQPQTQHKKSLSNKNGAYWFVNTFLICVDENIYVLIVLYTNISTKLSRFLVSQSFSYSFFIILKTVSYTEVFPFHFSRETAVEI